MTLKFGMVRRILILVSSLRDDLGKLIRELEELERCSK